MEQRPPANTSQAHGEDTDQSKTYFDEEDVPIDELDGLHTLDNNLVEEWPQLCSRIIELNLAETTAHMIHLSNNVIVGYFTNRPTLLQDFKFWVREELERKSGWPVIHTQYLGKTFSHRVC